jgi:hypothetical protein
MRHASSLCPAFSGNVFASVGSVIRLNHLQKLFSHMFSGSYRVFHFEGHRVISQELSRLAWTNAELDFRLKDDPGKLATAARVRKEATLPLRWFAARLQLGSPQSVRSMLYDRIPPT